MDIKKRLHITLASVLLLSLGVSAGVWAQDTAQAVPQAPSAASNIRQTFQADYFAEFGPQNALDMIRRVPGFRLRVSNNDSRGLGQRTDNVLLNGRQLSSKSSNISDQLQRLTAGKVIRIEIIDGTTLGIPGLSGDVANVITKAGGLTGTWQWSPQFREGLQPRLNDYRLSIAGETNQLDYSVSLSDNGRRNGGSGLETRTLEDGTLFEERLDDVQIFLSNPTLTGTVAWTPKPDHILTLNGELATQTFRDITTTERTAITDLGETGFLNFTSNQDAEGGEFSFDYERPLGAGTAKLIGLTNFLNSDSVSQIDEFDAIGNLTGSQFNREVELREYIGRGEYRFGGDNQNDWDFAFETAFNSLSDDSQFFERLVDNGELIFDADSEGDTIVEEIRSVATLTRNWTLGQKWNFQASASGEYSEISSEDITGFSQSREFFRPRGKFGATYAYDKDLDIRLTLERAVGQLNFFAFIASVSLDSDVTRTGNIDLTPDQTTSAELEFDKTIWKESNLTLTLRGAQVDDVIDSIPIGDDGDGIGNLEDPAYLYSARLRGTFKGVDFNFPGLEWNFTLFGSGSSLDDPLTDESRRINNQVRFFLSSDVRYDFQNSDWAIGSDIDFGRRATDFRVTTTELNIPDRPSWDLFVEHQNIFGVKVRVDLNNLLDDRRVTERTFFEGRRDITEIDFIERRELVNGRSVRLTLSGNF
ncbi:MAG: TonB-dependent receptor plug domain-containing protein [Maricaulaceae bacterium]